MTFHCPKSPAEGRPSSQMARFVSTLGVKRDARPERPLGGNRQHGAAGLGARPNGERGNSAPAPAYTVSLVMAYAKN